MMLNATQFVIIILAFVMIGLAVWMIRHLGVTYQGRLGRRRFAAWQGVIGCVIALFIHFRDVSILEHIPSWSTAPAAFFAWALVVCTSWCAVCAAIRRFHDFNWPGWCVVPVYAACFLLRKDGWFSVDTYIAAHVILLLIPGSKEANTYGRNHDADYKFL